uniref:Uncharacterized protein n=1 Tax=Panagrolaimus davidi TaxID=227884 RepID=A0A914PVZ2_9BILA
MVSPKKCASYDTFLLLKIAMDSSHPQRITSSNRKRKAEDTVLVISKRARFYAQYYQQNFSMPNSIIFYVAKNPETAKLYLKMVKTCKYFFVKNPIIIIPSLNGNGGEWRSGYVQLNLSKYNCKYWITDEIYASARGFVDKNILSPIIPKLYQYDVKHLYLSDQIISYHDLSLIITSAEQIDFINVTVKHADSSDVSLEDIIAIAVNAKHVYVNKPTITSKTMKELTKLPHFTKLDYFILCNLSEVFNIDAFYSYMKKNRHTKFYIRFDEQVSDAFKNRLETIVDEILETKEFNYIPPVIYFTGLGSQKYGKLCEIAFSH